MEEIEGNQLNVEAVEMDGFGILSPFNSQTLSLQNLR